MTELLKNKYVKWAHKDCGGPEVHGTVNCSANYCRCHPSPDRNYKLWFAIASTLLLCPEKPHLYREKAKGKTDAWIAFSTELYNHPYFQNEPKVQGNTSISTS